MSTIGRSLARVQTNSGTELGALSDNAATPLDPYFASSRSSLEVSNYETQDCHVFIYDDSPNDIFGSEDKQSPVLFKASSCINGVNSPAHRQSIGQLVERLEV